MSYRIVQSEEAIYILNKYREMIGYLNIFEGQIFSAWVEGIPNICNTNLSKTLMLRGNDLRLQLNFDQEASIFINN